MEKPEIAIIGENTLQNIGLASLVQKMIPMACVRMFHSFLEFIEDTPDMFVHYFISSKVAVEHASFFVERQNRTFIVVNGQVPTLSVGKFRTIDASLSEREFLKQLLLLQQHGHQRAVVSENPFSSQESKELTQREIDVLVLIVKGLINKEIAERLNIGLTTVVTHRKNIMDKLNIRSVSALTIYAVMTGIVEASEI